MCKVHFKNKKISVLRENHDFFLIIIQQEIVLF